MDQNGVVFGWVDSKNVVFDKHGTDLTFFYIDKNSVRTVSEKSIHFLIRTYNLFLLEQLDPSFNDFFKTKKLDFSLENITAYLNESKFDNETCFKLQAILSLQKTMDVDAISKMLVVEAIMYDLDISLK